MGSTPSGHRGGHHAYQYLERAALKPSANFIRMLALQCSLKVLVIILTIHMHAGILLPTISDKCLACICHVESRCNKNIGCRWDVGSDSYGPLQIKETFWIDCHRPGGGYRQCANDYNCANGCSQAFMRRYGGQTCGKTCEDYARMHNGGPTGCRKSSTNSYWTKIKAAGCNRNS